MLLYDRQLKGSREKCTSMCFQHGLIIRVFNARNTQRCDEYITLFVRAATYLDLNGSCEFFQLSNFFLFPDFAILSYS